MKIKGFLVGTAVLVVLVGIAILLLKLPKPQSPGREPLTDGQDVGSGRQTNADVRAPSSSRLARARELIRNLRSAATKVTDVQALCVGNAADLDELRSLGTEAVAACIDEIADKTSPVPLRVLLIELAAFLSGHNEPRLGQTLMGIIEDTTDAKPVRMQALQWIPETGDPSAGVKLVQMLPSQTDPDLEFGITRALQGFKVPGSVDILKNELADAKTYLTRIAAAHALATQGGRDALALLQTSVANKLTTGSDEAHAEENAVAVHGVLALGEIPDLSSLPILERILKNPNNSVSVRSKAVETIATIGGPNASQILRNTLLAEENESVLVYVARGLIRCGDAGDAQRCIQRAATVSDSYTKNELERTARELQGKTKP